MSKDLPTERERLRLLERDLDPQTIEILQGLPVSASWRCLDLGAGAGSIAYWLADRCREGHVVAADIDVRFLDRARPEYLEVRPFDVGRDGLPAGSFDLIHARALLCHVPARDAVLARAVEWLAPGGWLVVGESYMFAPEDSPYPPVRRFYRAVDERWIAQGSDMRWARRLPGLMVRAGLRQLGVASRSNCMGLGGVHDAFALACIHQIGGVMVKDGDITQTEIGEAFTAWRKHLPDLGEELADIAIYTMALAEMTGLDLDSEVERKITKNHARIYARDPRGVPVRVHEAASPGSDPATDDDHR